MTPGVDAAVVRMMDEAGVSFQEFFALDMASLASRLGVTQYYQDLDRQQALFNARKELEFVERHGMRAVFMTDDEYPALLRESPDAPVLIYVLGEADLNAFPAFNVVGTRRCTAYGQNFTASFVKDMAAYFPNGMVVSGLAYGIDAAAHIAALECGLKTVAVMAHGLDMIYPAAHRDFARRIINAGGAIVSEYPSGIRPFQRNFLQRNRIVAGMCEVTVVAESEVRGGAMSTANQAFSYSREVFALPGRLSDVTSSGCNALISRQKAHIFTGIADFISVMGWEIPAIGAKVAKASCDSLFPELEGDAAKVYEFLRCNGGAPSIDEIHRITALPMPKLMSILGELEFDGIITKLPGARYELS